MRVHLACSAALILLLAGCGHGTKGGKQSAEEAAQQMKGFKMKPGEWEVTSEILSATSPSMPPEAIRQMVGRKSSTRSCVTPEQAGKPGGMLAGQQANNCSYENFSANDGRLTGTMTCSGGQMGGNVAIKMQGDYSPVAYEMNMDMDTAVMGVKMAIKTKTSGHRVGDCA